MNQLLNYLWEGSISLLLLYGFYRLFLTKLTFFGWNRTYLLFSLGLVLIIPLLSFKAVFFPDSTIQSVNPNYFLPEFTFNPNSGSQFISVFSLLNIMGWIYSVGVMVTSLRFFMGLYQIFQQIRSSERKHHAECVILINPAFKPASFFHYIFLPAYNPTDHDHQLILAHECNHAAYYHTIDSLFFQLIRIVFWFHPILKMVESSLCEVHEYQVDREVTKSHSKREYAHLLVNLITAGSGQLVYNFNQFQIKKRILMMSRTKSRLMEKTRFLFAIPLMGLLIGAFSCEVQDDADLISKAEPKIEQASQAGPEEIFDVVEIMPKPPGGLEGWTQYLSKNITYPAKAKEKGIEGTVYVTFVVNSDGSIGDVEIFRGIGAGFDEEALRAVKNSPRWEPGIQRDKKVNVKMRLPVRFALGE